MSGIEVSSSRVKWGGGAVESPVDFLSHIHGRLTLMVSSSLHHRPMGRGGDGQTTVAGGRRENGRPLMQRRLRDALLPHFTPMTVDREIVQAEYIDKRTAVIHTVSVACGGGGGE